MRIAVIGSREFQDLTQVFHFIEELPSGTTIVSGGARGVDTVARMCAETRGFDFIERKPEYDKYPKKVAPLKRNDVIISEVDEVHAFWDGSSHGTQYVIDECKRLDKPCTIHYDEGVQAPIAQ